MKRGSDFRKKQVGAKVRIWNIGNTTVRNPARIKDALRLLQEQFVGKKWDAAQQFLFLQTLVDKGLVSIKDDEKPLSANQEINGRKWASAFNQLGLAKAWKKGASVELTPAGLALLSAGVLEEDIFLRQLLKWQLPSPAERRASKSMFEVQPLRLVLAILTELEKRGIQGLTKEEIALFVLPTVRNTDYVRAVDNIEQYRTKRAALVGKVNKKKFFGEMRSAIVTHLYREDFAGLVDKIEELVKLRDKTSDYLEDQEGQELLRFIVGGGKGANTKKARALEVKVKTALEQGLGVGELSGLVLQTKIATKGDTLGDYADSMVRYFMKTGLFSLSGDRIKIRDTQWQLVRAIVKQGFGLVSDSEFLAYFYAPQKPALPSDDIHFLQENIAVLLQKREELRTQVRTVEVVEAAPVVDASNVLTLKHSQAQIEKELLQYQEVLFYRKQPQQIDDILEYFEQILDGSLLGGTAYLPAYLEWNTWRVFLAIDTIPDDKIGQTRNFAIDDEVNPIHHAKSGAPDMVFEYDDFIVVCEVTLNTGERQHNAEGVPVSQHVANVVRQQNGKKPVFCVFIAPKIDPNVAQTFFTQTWHINNTYIPLNIIPITVKQVRLLLQAFKASFFEVEDMQKLFESCCAAKADVANGWEWYVQITQIFEDWCNARTAQAVQASSKVQNSLFE